MFVVLLHFYSSTPTPAYGEIARGLRERSQRVWIGQPAADGSFVLLDEHGEVDRLAGPMGGRLRGLPFMLRLRRYLRRVDPDVVQVTPAPWSWVLACGRHARAAFVNDIRTAGSGVGDGWRARLVDWSAWLSWRVGAALWYDATLFLNEAGARWLFGRRWAERATVVPLGVGAAFFRESRERAAPSATPHAPRSTPRQSEIVRFVYLGTISLQRNLERVLLATRTAHVRATKAFRVTLLGPDDGAGSVAAIRRLIERYDLQHVVDLMEAVPYARVPEVLRTFDVALNYVPATRVQRRQTFLKVLECRAAGLPQITTRTPPNAAVVHDEENGLLAEDSVEGYAAAMLRVIDDPQMLAGLRRRAEEMRTGVSWGEVADRQLAVYRALGDRAARARPSAADAARE